MPDKSCCSSSFWGSRGGMVTKNALSTVAVLTGSAALGLGLLALANPAALVALVASLGGPVGVVGMVLGADVAGGVVAAGITISCVEEDQAAQSLLPR